MYQSLAYDTLYLACKSTCATAVSTEILQRIEKVYANSWYRYIDFSPMYPG